MNHLLQRILIALLLGFAASWVIPNLLLEIPRRIGTSRINRTQAIIDQSLQPNALISIHDYRWFGVYERQYTALRKFNTADQRKRMEFWWTWEVFAQPRIPLSDRWKELRSRYSMDEFPVSDSQYSIIKVGWPMLCFDADIVIDTKGQLIDGSMPKQAHGAVATGVIGRSKYYKGLESSPAAVCLFAPYRPIWSGLIFNTLFYAMIFWILGSIKRAYRHARRMHKGRCPMCAYELGFVFVDGCSECGWRKEGNRQ